MRHIKSILLAVSVGALVGIGSLSAQPGSPPAPEPKTPADITASGETRANLSPREMAAETKKLISEMEGFHVRVLGLQASARKSKDVIKLNCVNEKLTEIKGNLNIAEKAENDLTEAIVGGDRDSQVHQYSQVKLAHERATSERDEAEGCIGEEIVFVGPTQVDVDGPTIPDDPTDDPDDPFSGTVVVFEPVVYATPFF